MWTLKRVGYLLIVLVALLTVESVPDAVYARAARGDATFAAVAADSTEAPGVEEAEAPPDTLNPFRIEMIPVEEVKRRRDEHGRRHRWDEDRYERERRWGGDWFDEDRFGPDLTRFRFRYNRVEGILTALRFGRDLSGRGFMPRWEAEWGYAWSNQRAVYSLGLQQPLVRNQSLVVGVTAARENAPFFGGFDIISGSENTASFLVLSKDYVDWYEREGGRAWLGYSPSRDLELRAGVCSWDHRSLDINQTGLFNKHDPLRPNPEVQEGSYRAFEASATLDTRNKVRSRWKRHRRRGVEHYQRLRYERTGMDSDFDLWRLFWDGRAYFYLTPRQEMTLRLFAGTGDAATTTLPVQKRYYLGGLSTLRGHNFKDIQGDHALLANLEYAFSLGGSTRGLLFLDTGTAWDGEFFDDLSDQKMGVDLGTGVRLGHDGIRIMAAKQVNKEGTPVKFVIRFTRPI